MYKPAPPKIKKTGGGAHSPLDGGARSLGRVMLLRGVDGTLVLGWAF